MQLRHFRDGKSKIVNKILKENEEVLHNHCDWYYIQKQFIKRK